MYHYLIKTCDKILGPQELEIVLRVEWPSLPWADLLEVASESLPHPESGAADAMYCWLLC